MANYFNVPIGFVVSDVLTFLSGAAIPLIMISLGLSLELKGIKEHFSDATFVSIVRLIISPAIAVLIVSIFGLTWFRTDSNYYRGSYAFCYAQCGTGYYL